MSFLHLGQLSTTSSQWLHSGPAQIFRSKYDGEWYIYPIILNVHKNLQERSNIFKPSVHYVVSTGTNLWLSLRKGSHGIVVNRLFSYQAFMRVRPALDISALFAVTVNPRNSTSPQISAPFE